MHGKLNTFYQNNETQKNIHKPKENISIHVMLDKNTSVFYGFKYELFLKNLKVIIYKHFLCYYYTCTNNVPLCRFKNKNVYLYIRRKNYT